MFARQHLAFVAQDVFGRSRTQADVQSPFMSDEQQTIAPLTKPYRTPPQLVAIPIVIVLIMAIAMLAPKVAMFVAILVAKVTMKLSMLPTR